MIPILTRRTNHIQVVLLVNLNASSESYKRRCFFCCCLIKAVDSRSLLRAASGSLDQRIIPWRSPPLSWVVTSFPLGQSGILFEISYVVGLRLMGGPKQ